MNDAERTQAELEIRNVIGKFAHLADSGDLVEYVSLMTDDGVWAHPTLGTRTGRDDILAGAQERREGGKKSGGRFRHMVTTQWVEFDDDDHASSHLYWILLNATNSPPVVQNTGRYDDELRRTPEGWKLARRDIVIDVN